jgi:hypothetical protein
MRDLPIVLSGLAAFLALATLPCWYNAMAKTAGRPAIERTSAAKQCVLPIEEMRRFHMTMLIAWRDHRVRDGQAYEISLTHTCLEQCHRNTTEFCDNCHTYVGLKGPDCFECHVGQDGILRRIGNPPRRRLPTGAQAASLPHRETAP